MTPADINFIANYIALSALIPFALFSMTYATVDRPWGTYLGVTIWGLITSQALVLGFVTARRWLGEFFGYEWVAVVLYTALSLFAWFFYVIYLVERRSSPALQFPLGQKARMKEKVMSDKLTPPEIWYKGKRVLRTVVATLISALITFAGAVLALNTFAPGLLAQLATLLPPEAVAWLGSAIAWLVAIAGLITWLFAQPGFNAFLTKLGLGSVPQSAIIVEPIVTESGVKVGEAVSVVPDPKLPQGEIISTGSGDREFPPGSAVG